MRPDASRPLEWQFLMAVSTIYDQNHAYNALKPHRTCVLGCGKYLLFLLGRLCLAACATERKKKIDFLLVDMVHTPLKTFYEIWQF